MAKIPSFNKNRLRYGAHFAVMTAFDEKVATLAQQEPMLTAAYGRFKAALTTEDAAVKIARASEYSAGILKADTRRDRLYSTAKSTAEMWRDIEVEPQATAAAAVLRQVKIYNVDTKAQYDQETGLMMNFLQPFESDELKAHVATLGLTDVFAQMKLANEEVRRLMSLRGDERAENAAYSLKASRQATDAAYDALVERINALALLDETGKYDALIAQWSQEVNRIRQQILSASSSSSEGGGSSTEDPGTSTDDPGTTTDPENPGTTDPGTSTDPADPGTGGGGSSDPDPGTSGGGSSDDGDDDGLDKN